MRVLFIVNPNAGKGRGRREWEQIQSQLRTVAPYDVVYTKAPGHATQLARQAAETGYERVAAVGGDGTLFEVANGLVGTDTALSVVAGGTGNDYANSVGIPPDMLEAARLALLGRERPVDVAQIGSTGYFINAAGAGFDAEVVAASNRYPKYFGGTIPYVVAVLKTLWSYSPSEMEICLDGEVIRQKVFLIAVGIGQSYGGGMRITPDAKIQDGLFDVCVAGDLSRFEVLTLLPLLYKGKHTNHPKIRMARCRSISIRSVTPVSAHADGESIGSLPQEFTLIPGGIRLVCPGDIEETKADQQSGVESKPDRG